MVGWCSRMYAFETYGKLCQAPAFGVKSTKQLLYNDRRPSARSGEKGA